MDSKRRYDVIVLGVCTAIFFVSTTILSWNVPWTFNSPDENANAFFAETMRVADRLFLIDPANLDVGGIVHPRSVIAVGSLLVPGSFLGLPVVYGLIGKVVGLGAMRLLTPLLAVLAIFAWRSVVEKIFSSRRIALVASLAIMFHPGFWYYSARSMMHNVPFVCWLIFAVWFLIGARRRAPILAGVCLALAVWFRTSEVVWIIPSAIALAAVYYKQLGLRTIILAASAFVITLAPMLVLNQQLYLDPLVTGYTYNAAASTVAVASTPSSEIAAEFDPFHPTLRTVLKHVWQYGVALFPWMSFAALIGFAIAWKKKSVPRVYFYLTLGVSAWLFIFYGSWIFHDNPDPALATIGTSYVRYWLPIFVLISPFVAQAICWIADRIHPRSAHILCAAMILANIHPVFFAPDGLVATRANLFTYADERSQILDVTEENAIIIVDRADKFLWPYRRVVQPLRSELTYSAMPTLVNLAPLYYFGITFPQTDLDYLNNTKLPPLGLSISPIITVGQESLYALYANP